MRNRIVGFLIIGIASLIGLIIFVFNKALTGIVNESCSHGPSCPMWGTITFHTKVSLAIMAFVVVIGLYLVFWGKEERIVTKIRSGQVQPRLLTRENFKKVMQGLDKDEQHILGLVIDSKGSVMQSDLVSSTGFGKVKVTRILDRLESRHLVERKRRGMTNIVMLKTSE